MNGKEPVEETGSFSKCAKRRNFVVCLTKNVKSIELLKQIYINQYLNSLILKDIITNGYLFKINDNILRIESVKIEHFQNV